MSLTGLGWAVLGGIRLYRRLAARRRSAPVPGEPIERLGANLCRLRAKLEAAENEAFTPYKAARVRALRGAYTDVLSAACRCLEVPPPAARGDAAAPLTEIYRAEAALRDRGLDVRRQLGGARADVGG
jgi:hypothetical protein